LFRLPILSSKAVAYMKGATLHCPTLWVDPWMGFRLEVYAKTIKKLARDKHSSLFCHNVGNGGKCFTPLTTEER